MVVRERPDSRFHAAHLRDVACQKVKHGTSACEVLRGSADECQQLSIFDV